MKPTAIAALACSLILPLSSLTAAPIVTPGFVPAEEDVASVRFRSFANTGGDEIYLGVPDLGAPPRAQRNITWATGVNSVEWVFDSVADSMTATVTNATSGSPFVLTYANFAADLVSKGKSLGLDDVQQLQITVADRDTGSSASLENVMLDGNALGNFGGAGFNDWTVSGYDFAGGFTLTGDVVLAGPFSGSQEKSRVELKLGANAIPEPTALGLVGLGLLGTFGASRRR